MLTKGEIAFLVIDILLLILGWTAFIVFNTAWTSLRMTEDERREWLIAAIGLWTGIAAGVALVIFCLVVGALSWKTKTKSRLAQLQQESRQIPSLTAPQMVMPRSTPPPSQPARQP